MVLRTSLTTTDGRPSQHLDRITLRGRHIGEVVCDIHMFPGDPRLLPFINSLVFFILLLTAPNGLAANLNPVAVRAAAVYSASHQGT